MSSSEETPKYEVCFILNAETKDDVNDNLKLAFESMDSNDLEPTWITEDDCLKVQKKEPKLFVMDSFEGPIFDHLLSMNCRIVGPLCIISCLQLGETLPKRPHPVYSVSMRKITVTCSNVEKVYREDISNKVQLMGGTFSKDLTKSVTHLVVGEVGSKKYHVAANFKLPIMETSWVTELWNHEQYNQVHATDSAYKSLHQCPVFKGLSITVSQVDSQERNIVKSLIENNGGRYSGALKSRDTTHLVLLEPKGEKYKFALSWKLHCVKLDWVYDSQKSGYCLDESLYLLEAPYSSVPKRSTPIKENIDERLAVDCSAINTTTVSHLDETTRSEYSVLSKANVSPHELDHFDVFSLPKSGQFLDGCKIFLTGFIDTHLEKLRKIVNAGGGIRFSKYSESISHIVCGEKNANLFDIIKTSSVKPHILNFQWLIECCKQKKLVEESPFIFSEFSSLSPQKEDVKEADPSVKCNSSFFNKNDAVSEDMSEFLKQYRTIVEQDDLCDDKTDMPSESTPNTSIPTKDNLEKQNVDKDLDIEIIEQFPPYATAETNESDNIELFGGKIFTIVGFGPKDKELLSNMIESNAGITVESLDADKTGIAIVPLVWNYLNVNAENIVTNCWLQKCLEEGNLLPFDSNELFKPLDIELTNHPFENFVISISQYSGTERDCLMHLAEVLGAQCQEYFVRKANKTRGLLPNTHLVVSTPEGSKYEAAKKWKIPAVTKYWLLDAAKSGVIPPVEKYLVESQQNERISVAKDDVKSKSNSIVTEVKFPEEKATVEVHNDNKNNINESLNNEACNILSDIGKTNHTPVMVENNRVKQLIEDDKVFSPKHLKLNDSSEEFNLDKSFKPNFDVSGMLRELDSSSEDLSGQNRRRKTSMPLEEMFGQNLSVALENVRKNQETKQSTEIYENTSDIDKTILDGVVVCVSRKLAKSQVDLNKTVALLGGLYIWTYDKSCTHFVFQGKANDLNKEFKEAKSQGKKIVSPYWVYACKEAGIRVDEDMYPHTFKSRLSLLEQVSTLKVSITDVNKSIECESKNSDTSINNVNQEQNKSIGDKDNSANVSKQLDELIVAVKTAKADKRRSRRNNSNSDSPTDRSKSQSRVKNVPKAVYNNMYVNSERDNTLCSEPSQSVPITWDDPTGRMEREKIAASVVNRDTQSFSPDRDLSNVFEKPQISKSASSSSLQSLTSFHGSVLKPKTPKFMFTSFAENEKQKLCSLVLQLGGLVSESKSFDAEATHLILGQPLKNEKFLASVASGKWVLHKSYLDDSEANQCFVSEEPYEWGGESTKAFVRNPSESTLKVSVCPRRWRIKLQDNQEVTGAFSGWKVVILSTKEKMSSYTKILKAGGAEVIPMTSLQFNPNSLTHAFIELGKNSALREEFKLLVSHQVKCLKPEYLAYYLIDNPQPIEDDYLVPEAKELLTSSVASTVSSKRRGQMSLNKDNKKTRLT